MIARLLPIVLALAACAPTASEVQTAARTPTTDVLFWDQAQKESGFKAMETLFPTRRVAHGTPRPLPAGKPLTLAWTHRGAPVTLDAFMAEQKAAGVLVLQDGRVRAERYGLGYGPDGRWTSFSVAKSLTSTLVGAAVRDGAIKSLDDPVVRYIPDLKGSAYDGVSVRQLLTMTSGVRWNEDYTDPKSDVALVFATPADPGLDQTVSYVRKLPRAAAPGTKWTYNTAETNLIGILVAEATGKTLSDYLSEKVWRPYGMERDAAWMIDERGREAGGCCISVSLRDYGRIGQFILDGGVAGGRPVLPDGWIAAATRKAVDIGAPGRGYGYQWWTNDDGSFNASGIFGQSIHVDPERRLVVAISSAWPVATDPERSAARAALFRAVTAAVDAETAAR